MKETALNSTKDITDEYQGGNSVPIHNTHKGICMSPCFFIFGILIFIKSVIYLIMFIVFRKCSEVVNFWWYCPAAYYTEHWKNKDRCTWYFQAS